MVPNNIPSGDNPCRSIIVNKMAKWTLKLLHALIMWSEATSELPSFLSGFSLLMAKLTSLAPIL